MCFIRLLQSYVMENYLLNNTTLPHQTEAVIDEISHLRIHCNNVIKSSHCPFIKHKLNLRRSLLNFFRKRPTLDLKIRIKHLNIEYETIFFYKKTNNPKSNQTWKRKVIMECIHYHCCCDKFEISTTFNL